MTQSITFQGRTYAPAQDETVLDCLQRHGVQVPSSCRSGVCQSCMMKATAGTPPARARAGLKQAWQDQGYFLACVCVPDQPLTVDSGDAVESYPGRVANVQALASDIVRVDIEVAGSFDFRAGQFLSLVRPEDGLCRPYSIANLPGEATVELHVAVLPRGRMSNWLAAAAGEAVEVRGPSGECYFQVDGPDQPVVLAGTGTGVAPLLGVLRDALAAKHRGPIHLFHGSPRASRLYLQSTLQALGAAHPNVQVTGSVLENDAAAPGVVEEPIDTALFAALPDLTGHRVYLCGNPDLVNTLKRRAYLAGASLAHIHSDPFITAPA